MQWKEVDYIRDEWRASNGLRVRKQEMDGWLQVWVGEPGCSLERLEVWRKHL